MTDLFVYGTLQDPEVLRLLLDDPPALSPVTVQGWRVAPVSGQVFPALLRDPEAAAAGHHVRVGPSQLAVLDRFEGPSYDRRVVGSVEVAGRAVTVQAWVLPDALAHRCDPGTWTLGEFAENPARAAWIAAIRRGRLAPRS